MEQLPRRTIKIGKANVGLIGLDQVMAQALAADLEVDKAIELISSALEKQNYIPVSARSLYQQALKKEYQRRREGREQGRDDDLNIKIFGSGCVSCNRVNDMIFDILQQLGVAADIEQIHDLDEIWRHGIITTPALIINGAIKCTGRMPTSSEIREWLEQEIDH
jgi:small redox-active disulfide protein 2